MIWEEISLKPLLLLALLTGAVCAHAGVITTYTDRTLFTTAHGGALTVEDFGPVAKFPISTGVLNSSTNLPGIGLLPGDIQPGVTYSTQLPGTGAFFNIDAGGGFTEGFLDSIKDGNPNRELTIVFDSLQRGFGFDTNFLMGTSFDITVNFSSGSPYQSNLTVLQTSNMEFFGFLSADPDIVSAVIRGIDSSSFAFALDNFTYTQGDPGNGGSAVIPEPSTLALLAFGLGAIALRARRRQTA